MYTKCLLILFAFYIKFISASLEESLGLDRDEVQLRYGNLFRLIDTNNDSVLTKEEIHTFYDKIIHTNNEYEISNEIKQIDLDGDGKVTFEELQSTINKTSHDGESASYTEGLRKRFDVVDKDKDGVLTASEIVLLFNPIKDPELLKIELDEIFDKHDVDKNRKISLDEFHETSGQDYDTSKSEFDFFDSNGDGYLDEEELKAVYADDNAEYYEDLLETLRALGETITLDTWNNNIDDIVASSLTDYGEVIRNPEHYRLDIQEPVSAKSEL